jgi:hypothetical protein
MKMPVAIKNLTSRPVIVSLNSGTHLRLSPGEVVHDVHDVELKDNAKVNKLVQQRAIAVERAASEPAESDDGAEKKKTRASRG